MRSAGSELHSKSLGYLTGLRREKDQCRELFRTRRGAIGGGGGGLIRDAVNEPEVERVSRDVVGLRWVAGIDSR